MKLHENKELFRQAMRFTAQQMKILEIYVEKDYWVTYALYVIFKDKIGEDTVFKGGTSLLKCFGYITRLSEDVDLVVLRREGESNSKQTRKIKQIGTIVNGVLPEVEITEVTRKMGMNRKTAHSYNKEFEGEYGQVRDVIIVESTWLGNCEPYYLRPVSSFIYAMMRETNQLGLAAEYGLLPFDVKVLEPKRTLCEKVMSLVRFSYTDAPLTDLKAKIRHTYDLHQMINVSDLKEFFYSTEFDEMLLKVAKDDVKSFKSNNHWLSYHPSEALIFRELEATWKELEPSYNGDFKKLVFANFQKSSDVLRSLQNIKQRLSSIKWEIRVE